MTPAARVAELPDWLEARGFVLGGRTIPLSLDPLVLAPDVARRIHRASEALLRILARFTEAYPTDESLREALSLAPEENALVRAGHPFDSALCIVRFDAVLADGQVRFVELNADSPASMAYADIAREALSRLSSGDANAERGQPPLLDAVATEIGALQSVTRARESSVASRPLVAVVDATTTTWHDIEHTVDALRAAGLETVRLPPDELAYEHGRLWAGGRPVELVYRRMLLEDIPEGPLLEAVRAGQLPLVNPLRARVANNKKLLALLDDPRFAHLLEPGELRLIRSHVPWTRALRSGAADRHGRSVDLERFCKTARRRLVIKPAVGYAGRDVHIGRETAQAPWEAVLARVLDAGTHVVQELVEAPERSVRVLEEGTVRTRRVRTSISPFLFGGRCAGMLARVAGRHMVNLAAGGAIMPCVDPAAGLPPRRGTS